MKKQIECWSIAACVVVCLFSTAHAGGQSLNVGKSTNESNGVGGTNVLSEHADDTKFSTLYAFEAPAAKTFTSPRGSQPDTRPALGPDGAIYGMTDDGGQFGNGVIYRFEPQTHQYSLLHTFSALDANGDNEDGASPGVALTADP